ncbi:hypothetical protein [Helicobacter ganmani]|uniref:hypothetical protein n=2 Tax=Helicobacteraceae TaxID=72293 RepID=UPI003A8783FF
MSRKILYRETSVRIDLEMQSVNHISIKTIYTLKLDNLDDMESQPSIGGGGVNSTLSSSQKNSHKHFNSKIFKRNQNKTNSPQPQQNPKQVF